MKISLRNLAFAAAMMASCASFAETVTTLWADDFEWLEDWSKWKPYDNSKPRCGDAVGTNNHGSEAKTLTTPYIGSFEDNSVVTAEQALISKGYGFLGVQSPANDKNPRTPGNQIYLQTNYLKFGLTGFFSGIEIPVTQASAETNTFIEFDWCSQRQGSGVYDPTKLVVIVKNGENEVQIPVPFKQYEKDEVMSWTHAKIDLSGATINADTKIIIRNADEQWPCPENNALRYYIDNINIYDYNPNDVIVSEDFEWFGVEYNGRAINNCPDQTFDEIAINEPGKASKWSSSQYYGPWSNDYPEEYITAYRRMTEVLGYEMEYVKAEGKNDRPGGIGSTVYIMKNYVKFGLTGFQSGMSFPARSSVEGTATLSFDWAPQWGTKDGVQLYDAVELAVIVRDGSTVKKTFAVPASTLQNGEAIKWLHVDMPLEGVEINKGDFIEIRNADSQWPSALALRWYLDNVKVMGKSKGDADAAYVAPELYIKGECNNWTADASYKLTTDGELSLTDNITYTFTIPSLAGKIQFATADGDIVFGRAADGAITSGERYALAYGDNKIELPALNNVTIELTYPRDHKYAPKVTISGTEAPVVVEPTGKRKAYAHELSASLGANDMLTVSYKSTEDAKSAALLLFPEEGDAVVFDLPAPVKGTNVATVSVSDIAGGSYMWQINITSEIEGEEAVVAYQSPEEWIPDEDVNGGVVWIRDTQSPAYGYTVVGLGKAGGFHVYNPEGELVNETPAHKGFESFDASHKRSVFRGDAWGGKAVFADRSFGGAWVVDPLNLDEKPYNIFMPEGAQRDANGVIVYDAQKIASQSTTIAFQGEGEDTKAFMYDLNLYYTGNYGTLVRYDLGDKDYIYEAPSLMLTNYRSIMANLDIEVEPISSGFFVSQIRDDFNSGAFGLMYFNDEGVKIWDIANKGVLPSTDGHSISSGVAVNADETRLALSGYYEIYVFDLEFDANDAPVLTNPVIIPLQSKFTSNLLSTKCQQIVFDAADNLHIFSTGLRGYTVLALPGETTASTPATEMLTFTSGLGTIEAATDAPVEYFNLQGFRVEGDNLTPGIYIRRQGTKASKVVIR